MTGPLAADDRFCPGTRPRRARFLRRAVRAKALADPSRLPDGEAPVVAGPPAAAHAGTGAAALPLNNPSVPPPIPTPPPPSPPPTATAPDPDPYFLDEPAR